MEPTKRDDLAHYLLKHGFGSKTSDMSDCTALKIFKDTEPLENNQKYVPGGFHSGDLRVSGNHPGQDAPAGPRHPRLGGVAGKVISQVLVGVVLFLSIWFR